MHTRSTCLKLFISIILTCANCQNKSESCLSLYKNGVNAYLENNFEKCVELLENALQKYNTYTKLITHCRLKCKQEVSTDDPLYKVNVDNLLFYETTIKSTLCIIKCKNDNAFAFDEFNLDQSTINIFEKRKPYEYLHACYHQINKFQESASAIFTYLVSNPNDDVAIRTLKYYSTIKEVNIQDVINHEAKDFVYLYVFGTTAYEEKRWDEVIQNMEESLVSYLESEEDCRALCEGPFDQGWFPDFIPAIANHFTHCLRCKTNCKNKMSTLNGEKHDDLYPSHYHYLQIAYYRVGNLKAACQAVASYLLFYPLDETMLHNAEFYKTLPKFQKDFLQPRPEALHYFHRLNYETNLMEYIYKTFGATVKNMNEQQRKKYSSLYSRSDKKTRFVLNDLLTDHECISLFETAKKHSVAGDGYKGTISPHTKSEFYEGLSLKRAGMLVNYNLLDVKILRMILRVAENMKRIVVRKFQVKKKLHFTFTHMVCRSAILEMQHNRSDFSHAVHADNCNIHPDGECPKKGPAFTWRDYTAIMYLNNDFEGGELFFSQDYFGKIIKEVIKPTCGKLVAFTSGAENLHGVNGIKNGTRCALAIWLTHDKQKYEPERIVLQKYFKYWGYG